MRRVPVSLAFVLGAGCASSVPPVPMAAFVSGDFATVRAFYDEELGDGDTNSRALLLNGLAQVDLLEGDLPSARRRFAEAGRIMGNWQTSGGEVFGAIVGAESSKTWKGDPHEKAMNAFYLGLLDWWAGEPDNARAAFRAGIFADAESEAGDAQVDFALLYWLAGRASLVLGQSGSAEEFFADALRAREFAVRHGARGSSAPPVLTDPAAGNVILLVELGLGPRKVAGGPHGSLAVIEPGDPCFDSAEIVVDGVSLGRTWLLADLVYQARTRGGRVMEGIRKGKAVFKDVATVGGILLMREGLHHSGSGQRDRLIAGGGLLALALLTSSSADTRHWETLPDTVHALTADLPPGEHEVRIEYQGTGRAGPPRMTQVWTIDVPEEGDGVWLFRSLPASGPSQSPGRSQT